MKSLLSHSIFHDRSPFRHISREEIRIARDSGVKAQSPTTLVIRRPAAESIDTAETPVSKLWVEGIVHVKKYCIFIDCC